MNLIKNKARVERNTRLLIPYNSMSGAAVRHSGCSVANAFPPPSQGQAAHCQAPQALQSPCQVINHHHLRITEKQAASWECSLHQNRNIKNPKLENSQEFKCFLLLTWLEKKKKKRKNSHKKPGLSTFRAFLWNHSRRTFLVQVLWSLP